MWDCKRLWLLFIALLYLKDVRALGVWNKRPAQDWYSVAAQIPLAQPKEPAPLHDGAQTSTAMMNEGFQSQNIVSYAQATSYQDVSTAALQNSYGTPSVTLQSGNTVSSSMHQQRPPVPSTSQTSQSWMQNASSFSGSQSQTSNGYGLSQGFASQYVDHSSAIPAFIVTQPGSDGTMFSGSASSTSSSSSSSQSPSAYWQSASSLSSKYLASQGQQGINQMSSAPGVTVIQPASDSAVYNDSATSMPASYTSSQSPSTYWQSPSSLFTQYLGSQGQQNVPALTLTQQVAESGMSSGPTTSGMSSIAYSGFQSPSTSWLSGISKPTSSTPTQQGINQHGSVPRLTVIQPATVLALSSGSTSSTSSSSSGSQSPSVYWQSPSSLFTQYLGSQGQQNVNQVSSASGLTTTQQAAPSIVSSGSTSSTSSSSSGSQSPSIYWPSQSSGINQMSSAPGLTVIQPASDSAVYNDSATSMPGSYTSSQSPSTYWQSASSPFTQYLGSQGQQSINQRNSAPGLTTTQQAAPSIVSSGSTSSTSSSSSGSQSPSVYWQSPSSQSQSSTGHGLSQRLASRYGGFWMWPDQNQLSSAPALTLTQQVAESGMSSGPTTSGMSSIAYSGFQSPSTSWLSGISKPTSSTPTQQGINQHGSVPRLTVIQPSTVIALSNGSTSSTSSSYSSPSSTSSGQSLSSLGSPGQQSVNQMSSTPALTVTQQSMPNVASSGSASSTSSSSSGSQSPSAYWQSVSSLSSQYLGSQGQQSVNQLTSAPGVTVIQPASDSAVYNDSATSMPGSYTSSQSPSTYWQSSSSLFTQYLGSQGQQSVNQMSSVPGSTVIQPASPSVVSSGSTSSSYTGSQSQPSTGYWVSQWLANQHGKIQTQQGINEMSSAPGLTVTQQSMPNVASSGSTSSTSSSYMPSQSQTSSGYGLSQWLVSRNGSFEMWPEQNQLHSAPASTMTQQVVESGMSSGSTTSGISSTGSQSPSTSWLSGIFKPTHGTPTQQGINQLVSVPGLTGIKPASVSNGSTVSASGSYGVAHIQSPSAYWQSPSSLSSQYLGSQGQQSVNQLSSAPGLTVTQQAAPSVVSSGTSTSSSPTGFQSQSTSGYWSSQGLSNHHDGLQTEGTHQLNQQASSTLTSSGPNVSTSSTTTSNLGIQSMNVPKPQAFNLWMGRYSCKSGSSSNASMLS
ncbi:serine-rich adhesin for platelets-like isoform X2 [Tachysurus fulvidraco]|uniref:serine-rich adhesin for platelets-like isoform X2 n=1 Tax=Tachysurus fulvidraco TaxID=1234273 RepID=UPI001FED838D|nr:serine-rich adhesin for platelets-like isoform X2 [Tachysurus fulvidraco]